MTDRQIREIARAAILWRRLVKLQHDPVTVERSLDALTELIDTYLLDSA